MSAAATRRGKRTGLIVAVVCLALVLLASTAIGRFDADALRPRVEAAFARATGRTLRIDGPLRLTLLPAPGFVASGVSIANLAGGSRPAMATARSVRASFDLASLFERRIRIDNLVVDRPDLLLEDVAGVPNWRLRPGRAASAGPDAPHRPTPSPRIEIFDASGGTIAWHDLPRLGSGAFALQTFHAQLEDGGTTLSIYAAGRHGSARFAASAAVGAAILTTATGPAQPIPVRATLTTGDERANLLHLDGTIEHTGGNTRFSGNLHGTLAQLADANALFPHAGLPRAADLRLDAAIRQDEAGSWQILSGTASAVQVDLARLRPGLEATRIAIGIPGPDRPATLDAAGTLAASPFTLRGTAGTAAFWTGSAATTPIDLAASLGPNRLSLAGTLSQTSARALDALDADLHLALPEPALLRSLAQTPNLPPLDVAGHLRGTRTAAQTTVRLDAATLDIDHTAWPASTLTLATTRNAPSRRITVQSAGAATPWLVWSEEGRAPGRIAITLDAHGLPAGPLALLATGRRSVSGLLDVAATLQAQSNAGGIDEATLDGPITARILDADIDASVVRSALGDVLRVARLPRLPASAAHVRCAALAGAFHGGSLQLVRLSADAALLSLTGSGTADIPRHSLDLHLEPQIRVGGTGLATAVALSGPLDAPVASLQAGADGRVGFQLGRAAAPDLGACNASPGAPPVRKAPRAADILRSLGLIR